MAVNVGVASAYGDWSEVGGAAGRLALNLICIITAVVATLSLQRWSYRRRRRLSRGSRRLAQR